MDACSREVEPSRPAGGVNILFEMSLVSRLIVICEKGVDEQERERKREKKPLKCPSTVDLI